MCRPQRQQHTTQPNHCDNICAAVLAAVQPGFSPASLKTLTQPVTRAHTHTQVEAFDASVGLYGRLAFLLWRSVYLTKQVSLRNRVLILFGA